MGQTAILFTQPFDLFQNGSCFAGGSFTCLVATTDCFSAALLSWTVLYTVC